MFTSINIAFAKGCPRCPISHTLRSFQHPLINLIEEKDERIVKFGKKIDDLEKRLTAKKDNEINKKLQNLETLINKENKYNKKTLETNVKDITKVILKCTKCEFTSYSESGLKIHIKRIHDKLSKNKEATGFPIKCDLCNTELKSNNEMKSRMKKHSYKLIQYKCEKCDFLGTNSVTMDVHHGKEHSDCL